MIRLLAFYMYYYPYFYYYSFIKNANNLIKVANQMEPEENQGVMNRLGIGYGYRAMPHLLNSFYFSTVRGFVKEIGKIRDID